MLLTPNMIVEFTGFATGFFRRRKGMVRHGTGNRTGDRVVAVNGMQKRATVRFEWLVPAPTDAAQIGWQPVPVGGKVIDGSRSNGHALKMPP
jgi:hypothetical protein